MWEQKANSLLLTRIVIISISCKFQADWMIYSPSVLPSCRPCRSINCGADHCHKLNIQTNLGLLKPSKTFQNFRIRSAHNEDGDSTDQPPEPSTSQPFVQWAPLGPSPSAKKPPRLVKTRRGIPMFIAPIPEDRCPECNGNGKLTCGACKGKGRLNYRKAAMLPSGVWPEWCPHCRASGRWVCSACMGTGERREPMGFRIE